MSYCARRRLLKQLDARTMSHYKDWKRDRWWWRWWQ